MQYIDRVNISRNEASFDAEIEVLTYTLVLSSAHWNSNHADAKDGLAADVAHVKQPAVKEM